MPAGSATGRGDRVVALTPDHAAGLVTSQRATITTLQGGDQTITVCTDDNRQVTLGREQLAPTGSGTATPPPSTAPKAPPSTAPTSTPMAAAESSPMWP
jgi:hypothetical protein